MHTPLSIILPYIPSIIVRNISFHNPRSRQRLKLLFGRNWFQVPRLGDTQGVLGIVGQGTVCAVWTIYGIVDVFARNIH